MPETRLAVVSTYQIADMLLKPVGWFSPTPFYVFLPDTLYTLDFVGSSASSSSVSVSTSATVNPYPNVPLTPTPTAYRLKFTTKGAGLVSQIAFYMYATDINLTGVQLSYDLSGVTIPVGDAFGSGITTTKQQLLERSSAGDEYIYTKANKRTVERPLLFEGVNKALCDAVVNFHDTVAEGSRYPFTLIDAYDVSHAVRFTAGGVQFSPIGGGFYELRMKLEELL